MIVTVEPVCKLDNENRKGCPANVRFPLYFTTPPLQMLSIRKKDVRAGITSIPTHADTV